MTLDLEMPDTIGPARDGMGPCSTGPKALTYAEAADELSDVLGKPVRYVGLPDAEARAAMLRRGMPGFSVDALMGVARAYRTGGAETVTPTVADLTGRAPMGFADFVRQNRHFFD